MFEITDNYFIAEDLLVDHLKSTPGIHRVYKTDELANLQERSQGTPSLHVVYQSEDYDSAGGGSYMTTKQVWMVVLAVKNTEKNTGKMMTDVIRKLAGQNVGGIIWKRVEANSKPLFTKGYKYYPLAFQCQVKMNMNT